MRAAALASACGFAACYSNKGAPTTRSNAVSPGRLAWGSGAMFTRTPMHSGRESSDATAWVVGVMTSTRRYRGVRRAARAACRRRVEVRARAGCRPSQTGPLRDRGGDPTAVVGDRRASPHVTAAGRGVHDRRRGPSPPDPTSRARRSRNRRIPQAERLGRPRGARIATGAALTWRPSSTAVSLLRIPVPFSVPQPPQTLLQSQRAAES